MSVKVQSIPVVEVSVNELEEILTRARKSLPPRDFEVLESIVQAYGHLSELIQDKQASLAYLRQLFFGPTSEKREKVLGGEAPTAPGGEDEPPAPSSRKKPKARAKGHGRNGAQAYSGAEQVPVPHPTLHPGDPCPTCTSKVYARPPRRLVRIRGVVPFAATVYEQECLRCGLCGEVFTAPAPEGVGEEKYDATAGSMAAVLRYGAGLPMNRIEQLQASAGIPMPVSTQWDLLQNTAAKVRPAYEELLRLAAQGELFHNDDTPMVVLSFLKDTQERRANGERTGVFTTGIVSVVGAWRIVLYATGRRHAGENLFDLLQRRASGLPPPTQMCDGLDRNLPGNLETIVSNCLAHGRRKFVEVVTSFPEQVRHVLDELALVYRNDAQARMQDMTPAQRLRFHQAESGPVMERLAGWLAAQIAEKQVEPNSGLGKAIAYVRKRWVRMTLFLRKEGAPLDNNLCERVLKGAILHRKNSLFYKTENGARIGDRFMSLIATARLANVDPFDYLTELQRHAPEVARNPSSWLPWEYKHTLDRGRGPAPPA